MDHGNGPGYLGTLEVFFRIRPPPPDTTPLSITPPSKTVVNLSTSVQISDAHLQLLNKGLSFIPTSTRFPDVRKSLAAYLQLYHRRLKLATHFGPSKPRTAQPFHLGSSWEPKDQSLPEALRRLIQKDQRDLAHLPILPETPNLTTQEQEKLEELRQLKTIVIKPADKGSAIVIMDRKDYIKEALRQLQDRKYYQPLPKPLHPQTATRVHDILNQLLLSKHITRSQFLYLKGQSPYRPRYFYLLPKIHKPPDTWTVPHKIPPGRPIVSDCGSESYGSAELLNHFLNPLSNRHPSYVRDTNDFVHKVRSLTLTEPCFLFSMDVESLYTNIDTTRGMQAVQQILEKYPNPGRPDTLLLELLHINLTCNDFLFDKQYYLQTKGTAMGKRFSPAYANIYMANWEASVFQKCTKLPLIYLRYLDDIWGIWTHSETDFQHFVDTLNGHHDCIKLKPVLHKTEINFLDTTTFKGSTFDTTGKLDIKVFFKETDSHALLHKGSFHPKHTFRGILRSQLLRFRRICTQPGDRAEATKTLFQALRNRGYTRSFLRMVAKTVDSKVPTPLSVTPETQPPPTDPPLVPIVSIFSSSSTRIHRSFKENFRDIMGGANLLPSYRLISAFKKNPNLQDLLVRARLPPLRTKIKLPKSPQAITNHGNRVKFFVQKGLNLSSLNCVYLIFCKQCQAQYVGETRNPLRTRLYAHRHNILRGRKTDTTLVQHFQRHGLHNLRMMGLESRAGWSTGQRRAAERKWIKRLGCIIPHGLNEEY